MHTRLIMVEGVPFSGKSTLSEFVAVQLGLNGSPAQWVPEGMMLQRYFPHVLAVLERQQVIAEASLWADWSAFVEVVRSAASTYVVDAALSYAAIYPLMVADRPRDAIRAEVARIAELCVPLQPRVIHLTGDVQRLTQVSIEQRGPGWQEHMLGQSNAAPYQQARGRSGIPGAIAFLEETQVLTAEILTKGGWPTLTLDVSAIDWATNRRAALSFLGIAEVAA